MWLNLPFARVSRSVEQNMHTTFSFPNPLSEVGELQSWGCSRDSAIIIDAIRRSFLTKSATAAMFTSVRVSFGRTPLSSPSTSSLLSWNWEYHLKTFDRFRAFCMNTSMSVTYRLALKQNFVATAVHFRHPWHIKKTDFTSQVITDTLSKINKWNSVCERMLVDST